MKQVVKVNMQKLSQQPAGSQCRSDFLLLHSAPMPSERRQGLGKKAKSLSTHLKEIEREYSQLFGNTPSLDRCSDVQPTFGATAASIAASDNVVPSITLRTFMVQQQPIDRSAARSLLCCLALLFLSNAARWAGLEAPLSSLSLSLC